jgi:exopolyphosphatase/guanosine-5'-triphosphate,3'-diphosphate pyrophosphatase
MRIGIIDLGTNTFNLLIADQTVNGFEKLFKKRGPVKLGQGGINKGFIAPDAQERGISILKEHLKTINEYLVDKYYAFATSAIRTAANGEEYVKRIYAETGIPVTVISGEKEAELICYGVKQAVELSEEKVLIIDIGGGSVEFIICNQPDVFWKQSLKLGIARLLEKFNPSDPIHFDEISDIENYLEKEMKPLFDQLEIHRLNTLVGSSGSFDTFARMISFQSLNKDNDEKMKCRNLEMNDFDILHKRLVNSTISERKSMKGLDLMRIEMIVPAVIMVNYIIRRAGIQKLIQSEYALKEGVVYLIFNNKMELLCE